VSTTRELSSASVALLRVLGASLFRNSGERESQHQGFSMGVVGWEKVMSG
jgi:hypothetical protein